MLLTVHTEKERVERKQNNCPRFDLTRAESPVPTHSPTRETPGVRTEDELVNTEAEFHSTTS